MYLGCPTDRTSAMRADTSQKGLGYRIGSCSDDVDYGQSGQSWQKLLQHLNALGREVKYYLCQSGNVRLRLFVEGTALGFGFGLSGTNADRGAHTAKPGPILWPGARHQGSVMPSQIRGMQGRRSLSRNSQPYS